MVQMVDRPILTKPYESIATDIVDPLPKGKGGARFVLTTKCLQFLERKSLCLAPNMLSHCL